MMELKQIGTVMVERDRRCDLCGGDDPEVAVREDRGRVLVYHWRCVHAAPQSPQDEPRAEAGAVGG